MQWNEALGDHLGVSWIVFAIADFFTTLASTLLTKRRPLDICTQTSKHGCRDLKLISIPRSHFSCLSIRYLSTTCCSATSVSQRSYAISASLMKWFWLPQSASDGTGCMFIWHLYRETNVWRLVFVLLLLLGVQMLRVSYWSMTLLKMRSP